MRNVFFSRFWSFFSIFVPKKETSLKKCIEQDVRKYLKKRNKLPTMTKVHFVQCLCCFICFCFFQILNTLPLFYKNVALLDEKNVGILMAFNGIIGFTLRWLWCILQKRNSH
ncbi:hypothetical protein QW060_25470 [Myroides ceti]|uniref:Uncharacterized protein n=1 Tax=Paenimyroides ceti TaxID=395087 RepID=A0ABT8D135_9FLAO|nr:hypothetical protein [Paenimyroides ceti]MDN3710220.1 hypothetical protein [Paenimyroides ceti]